MTEEKDPRHMETVSVKDSVGERVLQQAMANERSSDKEKQKPLDRAQRRRIETINQEAQETFNLITGKFLKFFTTCDYPESNEVQEEIAQRDAQWRTYCRRKGLKQEGFDLVKKYCDNLVNEYRKNKEGNEIEPAAV